MTLNESNILNKVKINTKIILESKLYRSFGHMSKWASYYSPTIYV